MKRSIAPAWAAVLLLAGCAGGWRNGPPAGYTGPGTPASLVPGGARETPAVASAPAASAAAAPAAKPAAAAAAAGATRETADGVLFVWTGGGGSAHLAGEFNAWSPSADAMQKQADGSFTLVKPLAPGRYAYKFVLDGSTWKEDPAAAEFADDGYGGKNSIIVVTGAATGAAPRTVSTPTAPAALPVTGTAKPPVAGPDGVTFTFAQPATAVALAGDFNGWSTTTDPLTRQADGTWTITKKLPAGTHAYKFVVNGTTWKQDDANPDARDDGFGGKNSVVTVK